MMLNCAYNDEPASDGNVARLVDLSHAPSDARQHALFSLSIAGSQEVGSLPSKPMTAPAGATWTTTTIRTRTSESARGAPIEAAAHARLLNAALTVMSVLDFQHIKDESNIVGIVSIGACVLDGLAVAGRAVGAVLLGGWELNDELRAAHENLHSVPLGADARNISEEYLTSLARRAHLSGVTSVVACFSLACQPWSLAGQRRGVTSRGTFLRRIWPT